ncbi:hypothetical protein TIFTF001_010132 [Ficus carica]|uniref:S-adenosyl-L-methionine-dependent methyltransferase n=1 Tax=Ficus carica TaxID=3494 RepID=A0AA88AIF8_FICCA|nr:hypothetical protein TIFTF001_010132 [Ficus carica]
MAGFWSAENATKAYLKTLKMGHKPNEPDEVEFISALAAGSNTQLMVVACGGAADATALALVVSAHRTGGRVVCILRGNEELDRSEELILGLGVCHVEFVIGDAQNLLLTHYREADFVLVDCNLENHEGILRAVQMATAAAEKKKRNGAVFIGYNAFRRASSRWNVVGSRTQLLPIGEGLLVTRISANNNNINNNNNAKSVVINGKRRSHNWIVKVDKCTGEEHVFRVRSPFPHGREIIEA